MSVLGSRHAWLCVAASFVMRTFLPQSHAWKFWGGGVVTVCIVGGVLGSRHAQQHVACCMFRQVSSPIACLAPLWCGNYHCTCVWTCFGLQTHVTVHDMSSVLLRSSVLWFCVVVLRWFCVQVLCHGNALWLCATVQRCGCALQFCIEVLRCGLPLWFFVVVLHRNQQKHRHPHGHLSLNHDASTVGVLR